MPSSTQSINRFGCAEPAFLLWLVLFYGLRHIPYFMPVIRQMLGSWTELEANVWYLPASLISVLLLYTWFNRIPEAGSVWRWVWRWGHWFLLGAYLWSAAVLLWLNTPMLLRPDHRHFEALLILLAIDLAAIGYLLRSARVRRVFAEFPQPVDAKAARAAEEAKAQERQKLVREARLATPIAQNAEQSQIEAHWRAEAAKSPKQALPWLQLGVLAYQNGQVAQAMTLMEEAHDCEPQNPLVLRNLCELLRQQGRISKAIAYGQQAVALTPNDEIARLNLAQALVDDKKLDQAITEYHRVIDLNPHHVQAWMNLAALLLQQGRKADADAALDAVLLVEPENERAQALKKDLR